MDTIITSQEIINEIVLFIDCELKSTVHLLLAAVAQRSRCVVLGSIWHLFLSKEGFFKMLPQNRKENTLQTICQDFGFQPTEHQSRHTRFGQDTTKDFGIGQLIGMRLLIHLQDANRVTAGVADRGTAKSQKGSSSQFVDLRVLFGNFLRQEIVRGKPRVMSYEGS